VSVLTGGQYHVIVAALLFTLATSSSVLLVMALPRPRRPGQLPYRRWRRHVPRRHAAVLAVLRDYYRWHGQSGWLAVTDITRRSRCRDTRSVLRRLCETGWAERVTESGATPWVMGRAGFRLTPAGWKGSVAVCGAHLPAELHALHNQGQRPGGGRPDTPPPPLGPPAPRRWAGPDLPPGHPSAPIRRIGQPTAGLPSWPGSLPDWPRVTDPAGTPPPRRVLLAAQDPAEPGHGLPGRPGQPADGPACLAA
jgi:hypothetical protein